MEIYEKIWLGNNRIIHDYLVQNVHFDNRPGFSNDKDAICIPISSDSYIRVLDKLKLLYYRGHSLERWRFALFNEQELKNSKYFVLVPSMLIKSVINPIRFPEEDVPYHYVPMRYAKMRGEFCTLCREVLEVTDNIEIRSSRMAGTDLVSAADHELLIASDAFMSVVNRYNFSGVSFKYYYVMQGAKENPKRSVQRNLKKGLLSIDSFMPAITYLPEERRRNCSCGSIGTPDYWTYKTIGFSKTGIETTKDFNLTQERLHGRMVVVKKPVVDALIKEGIVGIQYIPVDVL